MNHTAGTLESRATSFAKDKGREGGVGVLPSVLGKGLIAKSCL